MCFLSCVPYIVPLFGPSRERVPATISPYRFLDKPESYTTKHRAGNYTG